MGRRKRVAVVGLPKFASELARKLSSFQSSVRLRSFDTYYNVKDKLAFIPYVLLSDIVYSINGTISNSSVFNLALRLNKKLVIHWVGTDVIKAQKAFNQGTYNHEYINKAIHLCEVEWIRDELAEIGIKAEIQNFVVFDKEISEPGIPKKFSVLSYLYPGREKFYGIETLIEAAMRFPEIEFNLVGTEGYEKTTPSNMKFLGWVNDLSSRIASAGICVRFPEHDGLSSFVLESLALGKHVAYKYNYPHCIFCDSSEKIYRAIEVKYNEFKNGDLKVNSEASRFIETTFNKETIFSGLLGHLAIP